MKENKSKTDELPKQSILNDELDVEEKDEVVLPSKVHQPIVKKSRNVSVKNDKIHNTSFVTSVLGIKLVSALAYLVFFLPLIFCRHEPYAIFHANQSLALWLVMSAFYVLFALIHVHVLFMLIIVIFHVLGVFFGMYNATHNRARHFWWSAKFSLFKP